MKKDDITHLASLARIKLTAEEEAQFPDELSAIVSYVSAVSTMAGDGSVAPTLGARHTILRPDEVTNQPEQYTESILAEMPATNGRFMEVKKILHTED